MVFHFCAEPGYAVGCLAQIVQGMDSEAAHLARCFLHEIGHEGVEHLLEGFV